MKLFSKNNTNKTLVSTKTKKDYVTTVRRLNVIDSKDYRDVQAGDRITILSRNTVISGLTAEGTNRLYVIRPSRSKEKIYLDQLEERGETIESIHRYVTDKSYNYTPKDEERDENRPGVKAGSRASLEQAVEAADAITVYFENRMALGDPLFDQWMVDALDSSREASKNLRLTINALNGSGE